MTKAIHSLQMLLKAIIFFSALFLCKINGFPQDGAPLLYKVEKKGAEPFYLFGTIHMLPKEDFFLGEDVKKALEASEALVLELDITDPSMQMRIMELASMGGGDSIQSYLSDDECTRLNSMLVESVGIPLAMVQKMKPFMISTFLMNRYVGEEPASFELSLIELARADSLQIEGLETVEEQMAVFDSIPYAEQADGLIEMIDKEADMTVLFKDIVKAYKSGDVKLLYELLNENMDSEAEEYFLLEKRNKNWIKRIERLANERSVFIAVGAGHLGGELGLINLLQQAGYSLESLPERSK